VRAAPGGPALAAADTNERQVVEARLRGPGPKIDHAALAPPAPSSSPAVAARVDVAVIAACRPARGARRRRARGSRRPRADRARDDEPVVAPDVAGNHARVVEQLGGARVVEPLGGVLTVIRDDAE
jgi:hypothetical protein